MDLNKSFLKERMNYIALILPKVSMGVIGSISSTLTTGLYPLITQISMESTKVKELVSNTDVLTIIHVLEFLFSEIDEDVSLCSSSDVSLCSSSDVSLCSSSEDRIPKGLKVKSVALCVEQIRDSIRLIMAELERVQMKIRFNQELWFFKSLRSYSFNTSVMRLSAHIKVLEIRKNSLFEVMKTKRKEK